MQIKKLLTCDEPKLSGSLEEILSDHLKLSKNSKCHVVETRESGNPEAEPTVAIIYYTGRFSQKAVDQRLKTEGYNSEVETNEPCDCSRLLRCC